MRIIYTLLLWGACMLSVQAAGIVRDSVFTKHANKTVKLYEPKKKALAEDYQYIRKEVKTTAAGQLAALLGEEKDDIDSLAVEGPINADDFRTMWSASLYGCLTQISLEKAQIENDIIPDHAFCHYDEQSKDGVLYIIKLQKVILPESVKEIGRFSFCDVSILKEINIPGALQVVREGAFDCCTKLNMEKMVFPEGFHTLEEACFEYCGGLTAEVVFPSTLKTIEHAAFYQTRITPVKFPEGLELIGSWAFGGTRIKEAIIPDGCKLSEEGMQFSGCLRLEKVRLPEGIECIPEGCFRNNLLISEMELPSTVTAIGEEAFDMCQSMKKLILNEGLTTIGKDGLCGLSALEAICFPSTLQSLGARSCKSWRNVKRIYCAAPLPPKCLGGEEEYSPFADTPSTTPVYVPKGTAEAYRNAFGWNHFTTFYETDEFPVTAIATPTVDASGENAMMYDLNGKKIIRPVRGQVYIRGGKKVIAKD